MSGILETLNQASAAVIAAVLNTFWQSLAVAAIAWIAIKLMPRINAATRHVLWWTVLGALVALPVAPALLHRLQPTPQPAAVSSHIVADAVPADSDPALAADEPVRKAPLPAPANASGLELRAGEWPLLILAIWAAAVLVQLARIVWSYRYLRSLQRASAMPSAFLRRNFDAWLMSCRIRRPARLLVSDRIATPMAIGFRSPAVMLPRPLLAQFGESELDHVLLHELAHIARRDDWTNLFVRIAGAFLSLHPIAFWVLRRIEREREIACDDWVVSMTGAARPYAASLARLFELCFVRRGMALASGMAGRSSHLGERIELLLRRGSRFTSKASPIPVTLGIVTLFALAIAGAQAPNWLSLAQDDPRPFAAPAPAAPPAVPAAARQPAPPAPAAIFATPKSDAAPAPFAPAALSPEPPQPAATAAPMPPPAPAAPQRASTPAPGPPMPPPPPARAERRTFLQALVAAGYGNLSVDEIIELKNAGISPEFIEGVSESGWGRLSPSQMIDLCHRGVSPAYLRKLNQAGVRDLTLADVSELSIHGVRPEIIQEIHSLGFGPYSAKDIIQFSDRGIRPELFRALKEGGYDHATPSEICEALTSGVSAHDIREARQYGSSLTLKQVIKLKMAGVI